MRTLVVGYCWSNNGSVSRRARGVLPGGRPGGAGLAGAAGLRLPGVNGLIALIRLVSCWAPLTTLRLLWKLANIILQMERKGERQLVMDGCG